ncbi:hypothetical protein ABPG74_021767 [Tetrahymena malaccensis]
MLSLYIIYFKIIDQLLKKNCHHIKNLDRFNLEKQFSQQQINKNIKKLNLPNMNFMKLKHSSNYITNILEHCDCINLENIINDKDNNYIFQNLYPQKLLDQMHFQQNKYQDISYIIQLPQSINQGIHQLKHIITHHTHLLLSSSHIHFTIYLIEHLRQQKNILIKIWYFSSSLSIIDLIIIFISLKLLFVIRILMN